MEKKWPARSIRIELSSSHGCKTFIVVAISQKLNIKKKEGREEGSEERKEGKEGRKEERKEGRLDILNYTFNVS